MPIKSWHGNCRYRFELIIFGGFLGLNMIVSIARESRADFFVLPLCGAAGCGSWFFYVILRKLSR